METCYGCGKEDVVNHVFSGNSFYSAIVFRQFKKKYLLCTECHSYLLTKLGDLRRENQEKKLQEV